MPESIELLKLAARPAAVGVGGKAAPISVDLSAGDGWTYNAASQVLLIRHREPEVEIRF